LKLRRKYFIQYFGNLNDLLPSAYEGYQIWNYMKRKQLKKLVNDLKLNLLGLCIDCIVQNLEKFKNLEYLPFELQKMITTHLQNKNCLFLTDRNKLDREQVFRILYYADKQT